MQTSYGNSGHQLRSMNSATTANSSNSSSLARGQPLPLATARYRRPSASAYKIERNGYKPDGKPREVIIIDDDEDSPDPSSAANSRASTLTRAAPVPTPSTSNVAPANKRRRANNNNSSNAAAPASSSSAYYMHNGGSSHHAAYPDPRSYHPAESSSRRPAASGVGSKRKAVDASAPSKVRLFHHVLVLASPLTVPVSHDTSKRKRSLLCHVMTRKVTTLCAQVTLSGMADVRLQIPTPFLSLDTSDDFLRIDRSHRASFRARNFRQGCRSARHEHEAVGRGQGHSSCPEVSVRGSTCAGLLQKLIHLSCVQRCIESRDQGAQPAARARPGQPAVRLTSWPSDGKA